MATSDKMLSAVRRLDAPLTTRGSVVFATLALALAVLEIAAYASNGEFWVSSRVWAVMAAASCLASGGLVLVALYRDLQERSWLSFAFVGLAVAMVLCGIGGGSVLLNHESTQQLAAALRALKQPSWNYTGAAFLGYPSRQYLLPAVPTLLFGRNFLNLRLGYAAQFLLALLACYAALRFHLTASRTWHHGATQHGAVPPNRPVLRSPAEGGRRHVRRRPPECGPQVRHAPALAAVAVASLFSFPYVVLWLRVYEQTLLPMTFTMQAAAWLLLSTRRLSFLRLGNLLWVGCMLGTCYTPAFASWALLLALVGLLIIDSFRHRRPAAVIAWCATGVCIATFGLLSLTTRQDIGAARTWSRTDAADAAALGGKVERLQQAIEPFLLGTPGFQSPNRPFINDALLLPVLAYVLLSLVGRFGWPHFLLAAWSLGVIVVAVTAPGYAVLGPQEAPRLLHRGLVIVPPLVIAITIVTVDKLAEWGLQPRLSALVALFLMLCWFSTWNFRIAQRVSEVGLREAFFADFSRQLAVLGPLNDAVEPSVVIISDERSLVNADDYVRYFLPRYRLIQKPTGVWVKKFQPTLAAQLRIEDGAIIYVDKDLWYDGLLVDLTTSRGDEVVFRWEAKEGSRALTFVRVVEKPTGRRLLPASGAPPRPRLPACVGDCNGNGDVEINEIITCVRIGLEQMGVSACPPCDRDRNGAVEIDELITAIDASLELVECGPSPTP